MVEMMRGNMLPAFTLKTGSGQQHDRATLATLRSSGNRAAPFGLFGKIDFQRFRKAVYRFRRRPAKSAQPSGE